MKKTILCVALGSTLLVGLTRAGDVPPAGTYEGKGFWQGMDGSSGEYDSRVVITAGEITIEASHGDRGRVRTERHRTVLAPRGHGFFELLDADERPVGRLVCLGDRCSYSVRQDGVSVTESWRLDGGELRKFGSKEAGGFAVVWQETLYAR